MTTDALGSQPASELPDYPRVGPYRLVEQLGEGGMGVVHLALDGSGRAVAIKVLRPHVALDPGARTRLEREVATLERIRHPNVAPILDHDVGGDRPYVVTRYVPGPPLDEVIENDGPLRGPALLQLGRGLAGALHAIHEAGVIHRDVKPGNVLVLEGEPVLIDFGIAHVADDVRLTRTGLVMGTPGYLSPEIVEGAEVTESTDWWGWAATLGFAASGRPPFGRGSMETVLSRVVRGEADLSGIDPALVPLLDAALSPSPEDRPTDAEVLSALERYADGGAVTDVLRTPPRREGPATQVIPPRATAVLPSAAPAPAPNWPRHVAPAPQPTSSRQPQPAQAQPAQPQPAHPAGRAAPARRGWRRSPDPDRQARPVAGAPPLAAPGWTDPGSAPTAPHEGGAVAPSPHAGQNPYLPGSGGGDPRAFPPRPPMAGDPRIGRATRRGLLAALGALFVAGAASYPALAVVAAIAWSVLARTADRSVTSLVLRRHSKGARSSDLALSVLASPVHLLSGAIATVAASVIPAAVGLAGVFAALLGFRMSPGATESLEYPVALGAGMALTLMMAWWGPAGAGLRRGSRSLARGLAPNPAVSTALTTLVLVASAAVLAWALLSGDAPVWAPLSDAPTLFSSLTTPPQ